MKKLIHNCTLLFLATLGTNSFAQTTFQATYGGQQNHNTITQTTDGGYFIAGTSDSMQLGMNKMYLIKTDVGGDTLWAKQYWGNNGENAFTGKQTADGGYVVTGSTGSYGAGLTDAMSMKVDGNGDLQWAKSYGGSDFDYLYDIHENSDATLMMTGYTESTGAGDRDYLLIKTAANGDTLWTKTYGGSDSDWAWDIDQTTTGGYVIGGKSESFSSSAGDADLFVVNTDANGNVQWAKSYGGASPEIAYTVKQTSDGGYIIAGSTESFGTGQSDILVVKTDANGTTLWAKAYGGSGYDEGRDIVQTSDGGYAITGIFRTSGEHICLIKTDAQGTISWNTAFQSNVTNESYSLIQTNDGGYAISGYTGTPSTGIIYAIKTDASGNSNAGGCNQSVPVIVATAVTVTEISHTPSVGSGLTTTSPTPTQIDNGEAVTILCQLLSTPNPFVEETEVTIFPNPFTTTATLEFDNFDGVEHQITVSDISGKVVQQYTNITSNTVQLNRTGLRNGFYLVHIENKSGHIGTQKIIVR
jgi:hypothetical protein